MSFDPERIESASLSDVGRQRSTNQDSCGVASSPSGARLWFVADGMGGHAGGATASRLAVETVDRVFAGSSEPADILLREALESANATVHEAALQDATLAGMGTTGVAFMVEPDGSGWVANVGDSRAYRLRGGALEQLTADHSLVAELQRRGMLSADEAQVHPRRNEVLRSLGVEPTVEVDVAAVELRPGDQVMLCSDGLSGVVADAEIAALMLEHDPQQAVVRLVAAANDRGGPDNVTVQIAKIPSEETATGPPRETLPERVRRQERLDRQRHVRNLALALALVAAALITVLGWVLVFEVQNGDPMAAVPEPEAELTETPEKRRPAAP